MVSTPRSRGSCSSKPRSRFWVTSRTIQRAFRILVRDSPVTGTAGTLASVIDDVASQVEYILVEEFTKRELDEKLASLYSRALVGMTVQVGG